MPIGLTPGLLQVLVAPAQPARHPPGEPERPASRDDAVRPRVEQPSGRGLWLVNQLCDLVSVRSAADGTTVRVRVTGCR